MKIGQASNETGISIDTLRYYDKLGLVKPDRQGQIREYHQKDIDALLAIKLLKEAYFSLEEIQFLLKLDQKYLTMESIYQISTSDLSNLKRLLQEKLQTIDEKLVSLTQAQNLLTKMSKKVETLTREENNHESNS